MSSVARQLNGRPKIRQSAIWWAGLLVCWFAGTNDSSTKRLMFQVLFFFTISCKILCKNCFNLFFYRFTKMIKSFVCPKSIRHYKRNNAWNIGRLVDESIVPADQRTSILYCRLSDFYSEAWKDSGDCHLEGPSGPNWILVSR